MLRALGGGGVCGTTDVAAMDACLFAYVSAPSQLAFPSAGPEASADSRRHMFDLLLGLTPTRDNRFTLAFAGTNPKDCLRHFTRKKLVCFSSSFFWASQSVKSPFLGGDGAAFVKSSLSAIPSYISCDADRCREEALTGDLDGSAPAFVSTERSESMEGWYR